LNSALATTAASAASAARIGRRAATLLCSRTASLFATTPAAALTRACRRILSGSGEERRESKHQNQNRSYDSHVSISCYRLNSG
jgi:hypothetical protein